VTEGNSPVGGNGFHAAEAFGEVRSARPRSEGEADALRLARLRYRELGDAASALEIIEPLIAKDAGDDGLRQLYIEIAEATGAPFAAAETLERALRDPSIPGDARERIGFDAATIYLQEGELKQARAAFLEVVLVGAGGPRGVAAARRLIDLESEPGDPRVVGAALELIARAAPDVIDRREAATQLLWMRARGAGDRRAAEQLAELYADADDWSRLPEALRILLGGSGDDVARGISLVLRLEESALRARAVADFVGLVDEVVDRLGPDSSEQMRALARARARALSVDPAQHGEASTTYRSLIEAFENEEDAADFESFLDSREDVAGKNDDRRWLYRWRASRASPSAEVLIELAKAEEECGDRQAAIAVYERLVEMDSGRQIAFEALGRLGSPAAVDRLAPLLRAAIPQAKAGGERATLKAILGGILLEQAKRLDEAIAVLSGAGEEPAGVEKMAGDAFDAAARAYRKLLLVAERECSRDDLVRIAVATADACARAGGLAEAREALVRVADVLSQSPELAPDLERLCRAIGDWKRLASSLASQAAHDTTARGRTDLLLRAGRLLLEKSGDPESALRVIELAREASPEDVDAQVLWARAQLALGRSKLALDVLCEAARRRGGAQPQALASVHFEIAKAHLSLDEIVEAFEALKVGFDLDPRAVDGATLLGLVALDLDDEWTAERAFTAVTMQPPREGSGPGDESGTRSNALCRLAAIALDRGDIARARRLATSARDADPGDLAARTLLETLESIGPSPSLSG
jgi:hypothetical protein